MCQNFVRKYLSFEKITCKQKKVLIKNCTSIQFMVLALYTFRNTDMTDNSTQVSNENLPTQESDYTAYEQLEVMSSALVIVSDCSSQTCNEDQLLNESVTVENVSINLD